MQTRKRAKPVRFGKAEVEERAVEIEEKDKHAFEEQKEHPAAETITNENIGESIEEVHDDDKPEEISLSAPSEDVDQDKQEERNPSTMFDEERIENPSDEKEYESKEIITDEQEELSETKEDTAQPAFSSFTMQNAPKKKKGSLGFFLLVVIVAFLVGLGGMIGFSYLKDADLLQKVSEIAATPTPTLEPTDAPTPTAKVVDKSAYTITVLNGSGISGLAAKAKSALEESEFVVGTVGNADDSNYTKTVITAKEDVEEAYLNSLIKTLQATYDVDSIVEDASSSQKTDVVVVIGSDKAN